MCVRLEAGAAARQSWRNSRGPLPSYTLLPSELGKAQKERDTRSRWTRDLGNIGSLKHSTRSIIPGVLTLIERPFRFVKYFPTLSAPENRCKKTGFGIQLTLSPPDLNSRSLRPHFALLGPTGELLYRRILWGWQWIISPLQVISKGKRSYRETFYAFPKPETRPRRFHPTSIVLPTWLPHDQNKNNIMYQIPKQWWWTK